jgi:FtsZ-binding cell division protein ZapB
MDTIQIMWWLLLGFNACLTVWLIQRKRLLEKEYVNKHQALQAEVNDIQARNNERLLFASERIAKQEEYWREELRKIGIPSVGGADE